MPEARGGEGEGVEVSAEWDIEFTCYHCGELTSNPRMLRNRETGEVRLVCVPCFVARYDGEK